MHGDLDFARLAGSAVQGVVGAFSDTVIAEINGEYVLLMPPGSARVTGSRPGYVARKIDDIEIPVSTVEDPFLALNLSLLPNSADSDGDGMTNSWEAANGLDPENPNDADDDPDGDGLTNLEEFQQGSDPRVPDLPPEGDADGDGLTNDKELRLGTDPFSADTDGDGLDDGTELALGRDPTVNEAAAIVPVINMLLDNGP